jgi:endonuclease/exonuclease/phosphatase family metal-dependent hydrolase
LFRRLALIYIVLCFGATASLAALYAWGSGTAVELLRYLPSPFFALPLLVGLGLAFRLGWRAMVVMIATLAIFVVGVLGFVVGRGEPGAAGFRLMTWNAKTGYARHREGGYGDLAWEIATHDPDVLVMQDAEFGRDLPPPVREALRGRSTYASGEYFVASRLPMRDCRDVPINHPRREQYFVRCTLTVGGVDIDLVNVHLISPRMGLNAARREGLEGADDWAENYAIRLFQSGQLVRQFAGTQRPLIVAGDLNASEKSPVVQQLLAIGLRDAHSAAGLGFGYSHGHALKPRFSFLRIDHVLVSREIAVRSADTGGARASEHRPVIADLGLRRESPATAP